MLFRSVDKKSCVEIYGISSAHAAGLQYHGRLELRQAQTRAVCPYLIVDANAQTNLANTVNLPDWAFQAKVSRPTDKNENVLLFKRVSTNSASAAPDPAEAAKPASPGPSP